MQSYKLTLQNTEVIFNSIPIDKIDRYYNILLSNSPFAEEYLFNKITDNKYNIDELTAGIVTTVIFASFKISGRLIKPEDLPNKIDEYRETISNNAYYILYASIIKYMPSYTLDILKEKSLTEIFELFALAENIKGDKIADTDKMRELISNPTGKPALKKKGVSAISKEELNSLKAVLQREEFDGMPISSEYD